MYPDECICLGELGRECLGNLLCLGEYLLALRGYLSIPLLAVYGDELVNLSVDELARPLIVLYAFVEGFPAALGLLELTVVGLRTAAQRCRPLLAELSLQALYLLARLRAPAR